MHLDENTYDDQKYYLKKLKILESKSFFILLIFDAKLYFGSARKHLSLLIKNKILFKEENAFSWFATSHKLLCNIRLQCLSMCHCIFELSPFVIRHFITASLITELFQTR